MKRITPTVSMPIEDALDSLCFLADRIQNRDRKPCIYTRRDAADELRAYVSAIRNELDKRGA